MSGPCCIVVDPTFDCSTAPGGTGCGESVESKFGNSIYVGSYYQPFKTLLGAVTYASNWYSAYSTKGGKGSTEIRLKKTTHSHRVVAASLQVPQVDLPGATFTIHLDDPNNSEPASARAVIQCTNDTTFAALSFDQAQSDPLSLIIDRLQFDSCPAIALQVGTVEVTNVTISRTDFVHCSVAESGDRQARAESSGGAISVQQTAPSVSIRDCTFMNCTGGDDGGAIAARRMGDGGLTIVNSIFYGILPSILVRFFFVFNQLLLLVCLFLDHVLCRQYC